MKKVTLADVEVPPTNSPADVLRPLSPALGAENVAINHFELAPSESFGFDYHRHLDQEEVFCVLQGTATFETEAGDVTVRDGELVRFGPGEFQLGRNLGDERVVALALGAPRDSSEIEYCRECPACADRTIQVPDVDEEARTLAIRCSACDTTVDEISL